MLSLKIDNQFIALPDETEISIEASNPIFSDAGAKTYLFEIPVESLRYIIGNADEIYGESLYDVLEGKRAAIHIDGVQFFSGVVNLEDEISIEDGKIAVSIASGNLEFAQMIEGMNCRDVEQAEEVVVGYKYTHINETRTLQDDCSIVENAQAVYTQTYDLPDEFVVLRNEDNLRTNIVNPYPEGKFCNIRTACVIEKEEGESTVEILTPGFQNLINTGYRLKDGKERLQISSATTDQLNILVYEAYRRNSGICFYVLYFLDCLMKTVGISINSNQMKDWEDLTRLAFVNMHCLTEKMPDTSETIAFQNAVTDIGGIGMPEIPYYNLTATVHRHKAIATSENFPDADVEKVIEILKNAFGVRFLHNPEKGMMDIVLIQNILKDYTINNLSCEVYEAIKVDNRTGGFRLKYNHQDDDTSYYIPKHSSVVAVSQYSDIVNRVHAFDANMYVDSRNGNAYMVKVDSEADESGDETNLNPSLYEVGAFSSVSYGDCANENCIEEVVIDFSPIINSDLNYTDSKKKIDSGAGDIDIEQVYGVVLDVEVKPEWKGIANYKDVRLKRGKTKVTTKAGTAFKYYDILGSNSDVSTNVAWMPADKETAVNSYDTGLMLGIMRGPGSDAEPETFGQNFDGEGNYRVAFTAANYAFTSDSVDNCDRDFDYNGTADGVGEDELKGRFSLKLRARKYDEDGNPIKLYDDDGNELTMSAVRENRGLYDTFWKEYAYFTVNKKILRLTCGMEIADIVNIDWTKRYRIGEWTGFIANYSFNVNKDGMSEVELELYYL